MIVDREEVKRVLRITDNTHDASIDAMIPYAQADLCDYCNTYFQDPFVRRESASLAFVKGGPDTITDPNEDFVDAGFVAGQDIAVEGGYSNVGIHALAGVAAGTLTLGSTDELIDQDPDDAYNSMGTIRISRVNWPTAVKLIIAKMIWHLIDKPKTDDVKSERIDDYQIVYIGGHEYPKAISHALKRFRIVRAR